MRTSDINISSFAQIFKIQLSLSIADIIRAKKRSAIKRCLFGRGPRRGEKVISVLNDTARGKYT